MGPSLGALAAAGDGMLTDCCGTRHAAAAAAAAAWMLVNPPAPGQAAAVRLAMLHWLLEATQRC